MIDAVKWDTDPLHNGSICDTNAAAAMGEDENLVGIWRRCETSSLHTVPHTVTASNASDPSSYTPNTTTNIPFLSHAGAEDPMVYSISMPTSLSTNSLKKKTSNVSNGSNGSNGNGGRLVYHAIMHDEQITRCADAPVGCWPGGRHAFSTDGGLTWDYSAFDAYNGTVEYTDGTVEDYYLRARPHLLLDENHDIVALSNGLRPTKASQYVFTLVQPVV